MLKNKNYKKIIIGIFIIALVVRLAYIIKTPYTENQHDLDLSYIYTIYQEGHLPNDNLGQHYHPPLHQIISATFLKIESIFINNIEVLNESLQIVTVIYSMLLLYVIYNILKHLKIKKKYIIYIMSIVALHPTFIILSGSINNDNLCVLLIMWTILELIKWYKKSNIKSTIFLAIMTGLAVMAKTNGAIVAIPIIYVFLFKLYRELKKTENKKVIIKKYIGLFLLFGLISLPIGLWYNIRNYILFNQPLLYVLDPLNDKLYVGNYTLIQRFLPFSKEIFEMYCNAYDNYNIPMYLIKCSLYGEFTWGTTIIDSICYYFSIILNIIFTIIGFICIIKNVVVKNKRNKVWKNALFLLFISNIISFIMMNIKLQYGCSMDFRYIVPTLFVQAIFICFELENQRKKDKKREKKMYIYLYEMTYLLMGLADIIILCA